MNQYKCENHKLDLACMGCIKVWIARHDKLLDFVKDVAGLSGDAGKTFRYYLVQRAQKLLKEIGEG